MRPFLAAPLFPTPLVVAAAMTFPNLEVATRASNLEPKIPDISILPRAFLVPLTTTPSRQRLGGRVSVGTFFSANDIAYAEEAITRGKRSI